MLCTGVFIYLNKIKSWYMYNMNFSFPIIINACTVFVYQIKRNILFATTCLHL